MSEKGSIEAAKAAIDLGADVAAVNAAGETALHGAAHIRSDDLVRLLVASGDLGRASFVAGDFLIQVWSVH